ncbi:MAG TPA: hypothetical protein VF209_04835 [Patescibacteria group bacterium]
MDQLIILLIVISALGAAAIAIVGPFLGLLILVIRYLQKLWRGPLPEA